MEDVGCSAWVEGTHIILNKVGKCEYCCPEKKAEWKQDVKVDSEETCFNRHPVC